MSFFKRPIIHPPWLLYPVFPCHMFVTYESECEGQSRWVIWISVWIPLWKHLFNLVQTEVKLHTPSWSKNGCDKLLMSAPLCSQTQLLFLLLWNTEESNKAPERDVYCEQKVIKKTCIVNMSQFGLTLKRQVWIRWAHVNNASRDFIFFFFLNK